MKDKAIPTTLGKRRLLAVLAVWLLVPSAETVTSVVRADPPETSPRPEWSLAVRQVKVATPTGEKLEDVTYHKNSLGLEFVRIEPGEFLMGQPGRDRNTGPSHRVRITRPFLMGAREVTQSQWTEFMGTTIEQLRKANDGVGPNLPMYNVSWHDAVEFCRRLGARENKQYRLPTEAEWEYACRADTSTPFYTGKTIHKDQANYDHNHLYDAEKGKDVFVGGGLDWDHMKVVAVGSYPANPWGLYDMLGNVYEWCADWYDADYYSRSPVDDPKGPDDASMQGKAEKERVTRGFCFCNLPNNLQSWNRCHRSPSTRDSAHGAGFRVVVEIQ
jgi:formylglycine-generating enzyme required for sulfatase activity